MRTSSPYNNFALDRTADALLKLIDIAERDKVSDPAALIEAARAELREAQRQTARQIERNVFFREDAERPASSPLVPAVPAAAVP